MARASEQFRQSDVTVWAVIALCCGAFAVLAGNVSMLLPPDLLAGLHAARIEGASMGQLRAQVAALEGEAARMRAENAVLQTRFSLSEQASGDVTRRVGALEVSVPKLLEAIPPGAEIDRSSITASIAGGETVTFEAEGGSVSVRQQPMAEALPLVQETEDVQPLASIDPAEPLAEPIAFAVALGAPLPAGAARAEWEDLSLKLGPLLLGFEPLLADDSSSDNKRIIAGPIAELAEASALCARFDRVGIACSALPYAGEPLPPAQAPRP